MTDRFTVRCSYCAATHEAIAGTYHDGEPYNGRTVYGVHCDETSTNYGVLENYEHRL